MNLSLNWISPHHIIFKIQISNKLHCFLFLLKKISHVNIIFRFISDFGMPSSFNLLLSSKKKNARRNKKKEKDQHEIVCCVFFFFFFGIMKCFQYTIETLFAYSAASSRCCNNILSCVWFFQVFLISRVSQQLLSWAMYLAF